MCVTTFNFTYFHTLHIKNLPPAYFLFSLRFLLTTFFINFVGAK